MGKVKTKCKRRKVIYNKNGSLNHKDKKNIIFVIINKKEII